MKITFCLTILFSFLMISCIEGEKPGQNDSVSPSAAGMSEDSNAASDYNVLQYITLPKVLEEISGMAFASDSVLACVQDEEGTIFFYDINQKQITGNLKFAESGDYEALAWHNNTAYVLRSDGLIYRVKDALGKPQIDQFTLSQQKLDLEGLVYDSKTGSLLLAAKSAGKDFGDEVPIFQFNISKEEFAKEPLMMIKSKEDKGGKKKKKKSVFTPSDMGVDPTTGNFVFVDSPNSQYVEMDRNQEVIRTLELDNKMLVQPEGIAFASDGTVWISSEGKGGDAVLVQFSRDQLDQLAKEE